MFSTTQTTSFEQFGNFLGHRKRANPKTDSALGRAVPTQDRVEARVGTALIEPNVNYTICPHGTAMNYPSGIFIGMNLNTRCPALRQKPLRHVLLSRNDGVGVFLSRRETTVCVHSIQHSVT